MNAPTTCAHTILRKGVGLPLPMSQDLFPSSVTLIFHSDLALMMGDSDLPCEAFSSTSQRFPKTSQRFRICTDGTGGAVEKALHSRPTLPISVEEINATLDLNKSCDIAVDIQTTSQGIHAVIKAKASPTKYE